MALPGTLRSEFGQFSALGSGTGFPNPFYDVASLAMPTNLRSALYWAEFVYSQFGPYRTAMQRVVSYFLTEIEVLSDSDDEVEKFKDFFEKTIDGLGEIKQAYENRICYGNSFSSFIVPFKRFLICPKCGHRAPLHVVYEEPAYKWRWRMPEFHATCPFCKVGSGYTGPWKVKDDEGDLEHDLKVRHWNPHEIEILHDPFSHECAYLWRIPEDYKRLVRQGYLYHLERIPLPVLEAIHRNQVFRFDKDAIFHMKEPTIAGIYNRSWGIPRIFTNFRQIFYVQVLRRFNEAIALDYVIPFRVITPAARPGAGGMSGIAQDPLSTFGGDDFASATKAMIRRRRLDPASIQVLPFPVNFQLFGADANQLAPRDLLDQASQALLNEVGAPIELFNGTLQLQAAPPALRLFESTWHHLYHDGNAYLRWMAMQASRLLSWPETQIRLKRVTIADDLEKLMMLSQLMMSQQVSGTTVLRDFGLEWKQEQNQIAQESLYQTKLQARNQEEMQQGSFAQQIARAQGVGQGPGGQAAPPPGQGGDPGSGGQQGTNVTPGVGQGPVSQYLASMSPGALVTPNDMLATADSLAQQLLGMPETIKDSELRKLSIANKPLHALVKERMSAMREQTRAQAGNAAVGQMQPPSGAAA